MISLEALRAVRVVVSHCYPEQVCADGLASSMIVKDVLPKAEYRFICHNTRAYAELAAEPGMLFVDICPPEARVSEFLEAGALVLDHHKDREQLVASFGERGVFAHEERDPGVSGALLAFEHVWMPLQAGAAWVTESAVHRFAKLAGIRDTWQTKSPLWKEACEQAAILIFFPIEDWLDEELLGSTRLKMRMREVAPRLIAQFERETAALVKNAYYFTTKQGTRVAVLPSVRISDAADLIEADVVIGFSFHAEASETDGGKKLSMRLSFRSGKNGMDVSAIARSLGGGGHTHAAGASILLALGPVPGLENSNPYTAIWKLMGEF